MLAYDIRQKEWAIERNEDGTFNADYLINNVASFEKDIAEAQKELETYRKMVDDRVAWIKANVKKETQIRMHKGYQNYTSYIVEREERYAYPDGFTQWSRIWDTKQEFTGQTAQRDALKHMVNMMVANKPDYLQAYDYLEKLAKMLQGDKPLYDFVMSEKKRYDDMRRN